MLLSLSWLREFTPYEGTAEALGDRLTMLGLELEDIRRPYDAISSIVVGHVVSCDNHPESDHLHVCKVVAGQGELLDIVCGAPNVTVGRKAPGATVGAVLPSENGAGFGLEDEKLNYESLATDKIYSKQINSTIFVGSKDYNKNYQLYEKIYICFTFCRNLYDKRVRLYPGTSGIDKATGRNVWKDR
mgnify:CR=1 FL=1